MTDPSVVWESKEFGHSFIVFKLSAPDRKGRKFHLWDNGSPAIGGQWHYTLENAQERAKYLLRSSYVRRIEYLEQRVQVLESKIAVSSDLLAMLEIQCVLIESHPILSACASATLEPARAAIAKARGKETS